MRIEESVMAALKKLLKRAGDRLVGQALKRHGGEKMSEETLKFPRHGRRGGVDRASRK